MACCDQAKVTMAKGHWDMCVSDQDALDSFFDDLPELVVDQEEEGQETMYMKSVSAQLRMPFEKNEQALKDLNMGYVDGMAILPLGWTTRSVNNTIELKNRDGKVCGEYSIVTCRLRNVR